MTKIVLEAAALDALALAHNFSSEAFAPAFWAGRTQRGEPGRRDLLAWHGALRSVRRAGSAWLRRLPPFPPIEPGGVFLGAVTANQAAALRPLATALRGRGVAATLWDDDGSRPSGWLLAAQQRANRLMPFFVPSLLAQRARASRYAAESFRWALDHYLAGPGMYVTLRRWLAASRPRAVIVANDHTTLPLALVLAARAQRIPTFFVQHAAAGSGLPPLRADFALLDSRQALEVYDAAGPSETCVFLVGAPRLDPLASALGIVRTGIGICTKPTDPLERVTGLAQLLRRRFPDELMFLRPHPGTSAAGKALLARAAGEAGITVSDAVAEPASGFIPRVGAVVAGDSSVLLDAALGGAAPVYYDFAETGRDNYEFVARGVVRRLVSPHEVADTLAGDRLSLVARAQAGATHYCATIGTAWHGKAAELATRVIVRVISGQNPLDAPEWRPLSEPRHLRAFELR